MKLRPVAFGALEGSASMAKTDGLGRLQSTELTAPKCCRLQWYGVRPLRYVIMLSGERLTGVCYSVFRNPVTSLHLLTLLLHYVIGALKLCGPVSLPVLTGLRLGTCSGALKPL